MSAYLQLSGPQTGQIEFDEEIFIGRDPLSCRCVLSNDAQVSRVHARVHREGDAYYLTDHGSRNGTFFDNQKVVEKILLKNQDVFLVGQTQIRFTRNDPAHTLDEYAIPVEASLGNMTILASLDAERDSLALSPADAVDPQQLKRAHDRLRTLHTITRNLSTVRSLVSMLTDILDQIFDVMPVTRGAILLKQPDGVFRVAAQKSLDLSDQGDIKVSKTILKHVLEKRHAILTPDASKEATFTAGQSILLHRIRSVACVPMIVKKRVEADEVSEVVGILQVYSTEAGAVLTQEDLDLLLGIGGVAAMAIENARLVDQFLMEREKRTNLGRYLDKRLVEQILSRNVEIRLGGEVKKITVLFSDIRGFTRMTAELGAQEIVDTLNAYFSRMVAIIFENHGTLDKFIGDAIMAIWGAPVPETDADLKATTAAVQMQRELNLINIVRRAKNLPPLYMGVGLHSGEAVVGNMGSLQAMQYTAMGGTVNLASRIEGKTDRHWVLLSRDTYESVQAHVLARELPPVELKGIQGKVPIYAVTGLKTDTSDPEVMEATYNGAVSLLAQVVHPRLDRQIWVRCLETETGEVAMAMREDELEGMKDGDMVWIEVPILDGTDARRKIPVIFQTLRITGGVGFALVRFPRPTQTTMPIPAEILDQVQDRE